MDLYYIWPPAVPMVRKCGERSKREVKEMERIYDGKFQCEDCGVMYLAQDDPASALICPDCGSALRELDEEITEEPEDDETEDEET